MNFMYGCLSIIVIIISFVISIVHSDGDDCYVIHWLLGFCAALFFIGLMVLGTL